MREMRRKTKKNKKKTKKNEKAQKNEKKRKKWENSSDPIYTNPIKNFPKCSVSLETSIQEWPEYGWRT